MAWFFRHIMCTKKLSEQLDRIETLERQLKQLTTAVADAEDYIQRLAGRVLKRIDRAKGEEPPPPAAENGIDPLSAAIHARRNRTFTNGRT